MKSHRWNWIGLAVTVAVLAGLGSYLARVGLDKADKIASVAGLFVAAAGLLGPWIWRRIRGGGPATATPEADVVTDTGRATASRGGRANTGARLDGGAGPVQVRNTGDAEAHGPGSQANTGIQRGPLP